MLSSTAWPCSSRNAPYTHLPGLMGAPSLPTHACRFRVKHHWSRSNEPGPCTRTTAMWLVSKSPAWVTTAMCSSLLLAYQTGMR